MSVEVHVVYTEREHRYLPVEGVYTDFDVANRVAKICGGHVITRTLDEDEEYIGNDMKMFTAGVRVSKPEVIYTRQLETVCELLGGDFWYEDHRNDDKVIMYVWALDEADAEKKVLQVREIYLKAPQKHCTGMFEAMWVYD